ncbi:Fe2+-dependent dioxygenase [Microcoleus sp. FACHB-68]|uniref:Fe2+-dependent dioxygenase n=1 Tax=Microcoleus sp. FACHB-68 TaxID=2692826 RepID=UPI001686DF16|nr:Fe2+-dependent dioxygenase [Microcoleus sp. FACHB-68]MBD1939037.1 Fe2+-dependent dioxygenase [Microcoleus sp. FACHB-68]
MICCIGNVLTPEELNWITSQLENGEFIDGKLTAGVAAPLKHNLQLKADTNLARELNKVVIQALWRAQPFEMAARPKFIRPAMFSRYEPAMKYGTHVDQAIMRDHNYVMRSDLSVTLFLSPASSYTGGELVIESPHGEQAFKLDAGALVVYPSTSLHRVETVTQGIRLAAVTWVQSLIRDAHQREILFEIDTARQSIFAKEGKTPEFDSLCKAFTNLIRLWAEV